MGTATDTSLPSNEDRRAGKINRRARRAARYRNRIAAQCERRIRAEVDRLQAMGREPTVDLSIVDVTQLTDDELDALARIPLDEFGG